MRTIKLIKTLGMIAVVMSLSSVTSAHAKESFYELAAKSIPSAENSAVEPQALLCEPLPECIFPRSEDDKPKDGNNNVNQDKATS